MFYYYFQDFVKASKISSAQKEQEIIASSIMDKHMMMAEFAEIDASYKKRKLEDQLEEETARH